ncbi:tyrosine--tRNA ligase [Candidatus Shikimatogenerans bostrichidophilus]|uniref:tyrosine--tRNA ligase n=1 Tax=Candidatus Shikimatogenerans bostrichidophilus TaxID=2943807 RepID=UPI002966144D
MNNIIKLFKDLKWRKLILNKTNNIIKYFIKNNNIILYIGFDPTYDSLHIGHLLPISIIYRYYKIYKFNLILIGEFTAKINLNKNKIKLIKKNIKNIKKQIYNLLNIKNIKIINNNKWLNKLNLYNFLKKICKYINLNFMLKKKIIYNKLNNNNNIKITKFLYQLLQGYDYYYLYKKYKCNLQIGGSDQWSNILTGIKIIKKKYNKNVHGFTFPLLLNNNNIKFSKSNKKNNNIWLNKKYTSVYYFYQYFINLSDKNCIKYIKYFSFKKKKIIKQIISNHIKNPEKKILQNKIAKEITQWVHNKKNYKISIIISKILFNNKFNIKLINKYINIIKNNIKTYNYYYNKIKNIYIFNFIKNKIFFNSNSEYKKFINNNGLFLINGLKINNNLITNFNNLIKNKYLIIQKGKKIHFLIKLIKNLNE